MPSDHQLTDVRASSHNYQVGVTNISEIPALSLRERKGCPACGSERTKVVYRRPYDDVTFAEMFRRMYTRLDEPLLQSVLAGQIFQVCFCDNCSLAYQQLVPRDELLGLIYGHWVGAEGSLERTQKKIDGGRNAKLLQDALILRDLAKTGQKRLHALDYGAGWGTWCLAARSVGIDVSACEVSPDRCAKLREYGVDLIDEKAIPEGRFDIINCEQVFEHLDEPFEVLVRLTAALRPGGIIRISVPSGYLAELRLRFGDWGASKRSLRSLNFIAPLEHINGFTERAFDTMAQRTQLQKVRVGLGADYQHVVATGSFVKALARPLYYRAIGKNLTCYYRRA